MTDDSLTRQLAACDPAASSMQIVTSFDLAHDNTTWPQLEGPIAVGDAYTAVVTARHSDGSLCAPTPVAIRLGSPESTLALQQNCLTDAVTGQCQIQLTAWAAGSYQVSASLFDEASRQFVAVGGHGDPAAASPQTKSWTVCGQPQVTISPAGPLVIGESYSVTVSSGLGCLTELYAAAARGQGDYQLTSSPAGPHQTGIVRLDSSPTSDISTIEVTSQVAGQYQVNAQYRHSDGRLVTLLPQSVTLQWLNSTTPDPSEDVFTVLNNFVLNIGAQLRELILAITSFNAFPR
ncbi:MAG: hypothetical protein LBL92_00275 [Propionibacteriaceae bacterium]|nr:hypothetical protein [Propionibacteriaceae bacterium]